MSVASFASGVLHPCSATAMGRLRQTPSAPAPRQGRGHRRATGACGEHTMQSARTGRNNCRPAPEA
eukprot:15460005-Alexandrium_andersonii.AAC.1